ncbi:hypothetical protein IG631_03418 [Alternaria alternata]|nr:hypothetical protein IG631_03418 [Alternaria alternata]
MPSDFQVPTLRRHHIPAMPRPTRVPGRSLSHPDVWLPLQQHPLAFFLLAFYYHTIDAREKVYATGYSTWPSGRVDATLHRAHRSFLPSVTDRGCPHTWDDTSRELNPHYRRMASGTKIPHPCGGSLPWSPS